jgi:hypothetical protein
MGMGCVSFGERISYLYELQLQKVTVKTSFEEDDNYTEKLTAL